MESKHVQQQQNAGNKLKLDSNECRRRFAMIYHRFGRVYTKTKASSGRRSSRRRRIGNKSDFTIEINLNGLPFRALRETLTASLSARETERVARSSASTTQNPIKIKKQIVGITRLALRFIALAESRSRCLRWNKNLRFLAGALCRWPRSGVAVWSPRRE